jgi:hypothetical protein
MAFGFDTPLWKAGAERQQSPRWLVAVALAAALCMAGVYHSAPSEGRGAPGLFDTSKAFLGTWQREWRVAHLQSSRPPAPQYGPPPAAADSLEADVGEKASVSLPFAAKSVVPASVDSHQRTSPRVALDLDFSAELPTAKAGLSEPSSLHIADKTNTAKEKGKDKTKAKVSAAKAKVSAADTAVPFHPTTWQKCKAVAIEGGLPFKLDVPDKKTHSKYGCYTYLKTGRTYFRQAATGKQADETKPLVSTKAFRPTDVSCFDRTQNGLETGVDCGGLSCKGCPATTAPACRQAADAAGLDFYVSVPDKKTHSKYGCYTYFESGVTYFRDAATGKETDETKPLVSTKAFRPTDVSCFDRSKNGLETGVDCGGVTCRACPATTALACKAVADEAGLIWKVSKQDNKQHSSYGCYTYYLTGVTYFREKGGKHGDVDTLETATLTNPSKYRPTEVSCFDRSQNGMETGTDCGGPSCQRMCELCTAGQEGQVVPGGQARLFFKTITSHLLIAPVTKRCVCFLGGHGRRRRPGVPGGEVHGRELPLRARRRRRGDGARHAARPNREQLPAALAVLLPAGRHLDVVYL